MLKLIAALIAQKGRNNPFRSRQCWLCLKSVKVFDCDRVHTILLIYITAVIKRWPFLRRPDSLHAIWTSLLYTVPGEKLRCRSKYFLICQANKPLNKKLTCGFIALLYSEAIRFNCRISTIEYDVTLNRIFICYVELFSFCSVICLSQFK